MRRLALLVVLPLLLSLRFGAAAQAQPRPDGTSGGGRAPISLRDYSERRFAGPDGLQSLAVFAVEVLADGTLWIGTEAGPHRMVGARFEPVPIPLPLAHVRAIVQDASGAVWFGTRLGVVRRAPDGAMTVFDAQHGVPSGTVYSLVVTDAIDGTTRIVAATGTGVAYFDGALWRRVPLPVGMRPEGLVVTPRPRAGRTDELWLGGSTGQAARWADGAWQALYEEGAGLPVRALERFLVLNNQQSTLFAATDVGVFRFEDDGDRGTWSRLAGSPSFAYRMAWVPTASGAGELWVGTLDGLLMRQRAAVWDTITLRSADPRTPLHALLGVPGHAGGFAVYVGTFGDGLVRMSVGRAATLVSRNVGLRLSIVSVLEEPLGQAGTAWLATNGFGVLEVGPDGARTVLDRDGVVDGQVSAMFARDGARGVREVWVGASRGARQYVNGRWHVRDGALDSLRVMEFASADENDGTSSVLAATARGVFEWNGNAWSRLPGTPDASASALLGAGTGDDRLWIAGAFGTMMRQQGRWRTDRSPLALDSMFSPRGFCRVTTSGGTHVLLATASGIMVQAARDSVWRWLPERLRAPLYSENTYELRCDDPARVLVATAAALVVYDFRADDPADWQLVTMLGPSDGLPSPVVQSIGQGGAPGARWIGTGQGLGRVDLASLPVPERTTLAMQLSHGVENTPLAAQGVVPFSENRIAVRLTLPTFHREEDLRYQIELVGPTAVPTAAWSNTAEESYASLAPGEYVVRARARDYAGREYGPLEQSFRIAYPPWRSPLALAAYALAVLAAASLAHRWRMRTLRARAEQLEASQRRVRASEAQFRALFDRAHDANLLVRDARIVLANAAAESLFGETGASLVGASLPSLDAPDDLDGADGARWESQLVRRDGEPVTVQVVVTLLSRDDGPLQHWVLRDLSAMRNAEAERQMLESQVREAQKLESLGTLAGGVAHDFNNLLGVIRGNAELAREALHDPDEVADHLSAVLDASERARDLVRQILTFSRRSSPHEGVVDLGAVVRTLVPMLRSLIPRTVELRVSGGDRAYPVRGDLTQLQQLLFNLCSNAEYAMRPTNGGRLEIELGQCEASEPFASGSTQAVCVRVRDSGVGMSAEVRERVFEPFFTTKPTGEGTGLGLSVLHGIVVSHGGRVRVESTEGVGTTFEVQFPLLAPETAATAPVRSEGMPAPAETTVTPPAADVCAGAQVVLVDDEPAVARVVERALTRLGCRVRTFSVSRDALAYVEQADTVVDLVVTDQTMPGLTGDDLAEAVHRARPGVPVILVTGYSYRLTAERLAAVGATAVLQKPVPLEQLTRTVREALQHRTPNAAPAR